MEVPLWERGELSNLTQVNECLLSSARTQGVEDTFYGTFSSPAYIHSPANWFATHGRDSAGSQPGTRRAECGHGVRYNTSAWAD